MESRLDALASQINPHFLFNTLASVSSLIRSEPEKARTLIVKLSGLLRRLLKSQEHFVTLREELDAIDEYLDIESIRFGPQLRIEKDIDPTTLGLIVPSMLLQPLVENSIKHGRSQKLGEGLWWLGGGSHHSVVVEYPTYITVIESPLNDERALAVIAEAKKLVPNKPIKYLVNTHNHFDHLGGVRAFVPEGATIITNAMNKPYYEKIFNAPHALAPDRLSQNPKKATYLTVKDKYVLADGGREIDIYHIESDNHNEGMLMVYVPKEKVLVEADDFTPPAPNGPPPAPRAVNFTKNLNANIERLKLDVVTIAPLHGFVVPVAELKKLAGTT